MLGCPSFVVSRQAPRQCSLLEKSPFHGDGKTWSESRLPGSIHPPELLSFQLQHKGLDVVVVGGKPLGTRRCQVTGERATVWHQSGNKKESMRDREHNYSHQISYALEQRWHQDQGWPPELGVASKAGFRAGRNQRVMLLDVATLALGRRSSGKTFGRTRVLPWS